MATPMRSSSQETGHRARVADPRTTAKADTQASNFEYDDNEWDIGIGDLIIDLDADIEKTNEGVGAGGTMSSNAAGGTAAGKAAAKMAIEHSATVDKGLKMKIKRTKPGTKTSEAKHEIVKSNEQQQQNGNAENTAPAGKHPPVPAAATPTGAAVAPTNGGTAGSGGVGSGSGGGGKRGSSGHRRDKTREKHGDKPSPKSAPPVVAAAAPVVVAATAPVTVTVPPDVNGVVRVSAPQTAPQRAVFPASTGPGPPAVVPPGPPSSPAAATGSAAKPEQTKVTAVVLAPSPSEEPERSPESSSPPPAKKLKTSPEPKDMSDVCVGTSVGTITEPDCLGPCEPGTSVTLEGIVWHETEGGVLVVNVTWRGKTYVGTLLDCTRHDWAPPRFCDSPTSDLDSRTPKGRGKRGRAAASATPTNDLSNFTETRSSMHSKLRNGGAKGRRGNGTGPPTAPSSPTPFVPPRPEPNTKRKNRTGEEESTPPVITGKKTRVAPPPTPPTTTSGSGSNSPPASPILLECPEPNCSKKYKHINGLKYHQSHAHGSADDEDTKDVTSMSENDESNIEAPSPATPVKSPEKASESLVTPLKKEDVLLLLPTNRSDGIDVSSEPATPTSSPPTPPAPPIMAGIQDLTSVSPTISINDTKSVIKPGVLRFGPQEEFPVGAFAGNKTQVSGAPIQNTGSLTPARTPGQQPMPDSPQPQSFTNQLQQPAQQFTQVGMLQTSPQNQQISGLPLHQQPPPNPQTTQTLLQVQGKLPQFKVKPTAALMPDDKRDRSKPANYKKKSRKSPAGSPHPPQTEQPVFGMEQTGGREEVQSPAYSDISDDGAPVLESEVGDKNKSSDKKTDSGQPMPHTIPQYGIYPFYGQPPYLMPSVQQSQEGGKMNKESDKLDKGDKDSKKDSPEYQQKMLQQHYYPYGYMAGYPYNMDPSYGTMPMVPEDKIKEERMKETPSPADHSNKSAAPIPNPIQVPIPGKIKSEPPLKEKHQNENHQILKESIEMKSQMNPYMYPRQTPNQQQIHHQGNRDEDLRRYYIYPPEQPQQQPQQQQQQSQPRRKEHSSSETPNHKNSTTPNKAPAQSPILKQKEKSSEEKKEKEVKQEGVKPTMETQGPPPPPTSQYAYIHSSYMQSPHYGALPFDPNHPMYRSIMVPGPYSGSPYLHTQMPRYHAPEDLSRPPQPTTKALDLLQHHANQFYTTTHKIHELHERALKSPTPKTSVASLSPSSGTGPPSNQPSNQAGPPPSQPTSGPSPSGKKTPVDGKDSRSPPLQRHVHTHHHTHVGLGYPMYPAPYGAAVLASQQAAAVTVINSYPPK